MNLDEEVIVITSVSNIVKACEFLGRKVVIHRQFSLAQLIKKRKQVNTELSRLQEIIGEDELHYSHTQFAVFCFNLVHKLNLNGGKTVFHNFEFLYDRPNFRSLFNKNYFATKVFDLMLKIIYKIPTEVRMSSSNSYMISLTEDYIKANSFKYIQDKSSYFNETLDLFQNINFSFPRIDFLFIAQTFNNPNLFVTHKINKLVAIINTKSIYLKKHPKLGVIDGLENCKTLPDFLPVEMFFSKVKKVVISFHSASLVTASKFKQFTTISLLDLVKTDDIFMERVKQDLIIKSNNRILFPQTIHEFQELLDA